MSRLEIIETQRELKAALKEIEKHEWLSMDTETSGLNPFADDAYVASLGIGTSIHDFAFPLDHYRSKIYKDSSSQQRLIQQLDEVFKNKKKAAHNGKFDTLFMFNIFGVMWNCDFDTMLAHYNLDENSRHGLKELAKTYLDGDDYEIPLREKQGREGSLYTHCKYLGEDCHNVTRLRRIFSRLLQEDPAAQRLFKHLTMPLSKLYTQIELRGVPIDEKKLEDGRIFWEERYKSSEKALKKLTEGFEPPQGKSKKPVQLNFGSPAQLSVLLFQHFKLKPLDKTPTGKFSTNESVLKRLNHPVCRHILDNREASKNLSTFIESWRGRLVEGRIHPSFKIHGTVTGRPSCEEPNLQQTPRDPRIRAIIDAPKGWVLLDVDYSQVELRIAADLANERTLLEAYQKGLDVHTITVQRIFGIQNPTPEERQKGKAINFGFIYSMWWKKFIEYARDNYQQTFSPKEAERVRKNFFELYSDLESWHKKQKNLARSQGYVISKIGRKRRLPDATINTHGEYNFKVGEAERQAINSPVQSLASDINLLAAIEIDRTIDNNYCQIVGTVHDSILILVRKDRLDDVAHRVKAIMENPKALREIFKVKLKVPLIAEAKVGAWSLGEKYDFTKRKVA